MDGSVSPPYVPVPPLEFDLPSNEVLPFELAPVVQPVKVKKTRALSNSTEAEPRPVVKKSANHRRKAPFPLAGPLAGEIAADHPAAPLLQPLPSGSLHRRQEQQLSPTPPSRAASLDLDYDYDMGGMDMGGIDDVGLYQPEDELVAVDARLPPEIQVPELVADMDREELGDYIQHLQDGTLGFVRLTQRIWCLEDRTSKRSVGTCTARVERLLIQFLEI